MLSLTENSVFVPLFRMGKWSSEEDKQLIKLVDNIGEKHWKKISEIMIYRSAVQCFHRWTKILKPGLKKGNWSIEEDKKLIEWVKNKGATKWSECSYKIIGRTGKQCRERWYNTLNPNLKKGNWTPLEDYIIFYQTRLIGCKWSKTAQMLPGRTENSIKNRFYSTLRRVAAKVNKGENDNARKPLSYLLNFFEIAFEEKKRAYEKFMINSFKMEEKDKRCNEVFVGKEDDDIKEESDCDEMKEKINFFIAKKIKRRENNNNLKEYNILFKGLNDIEKKLTKMKNCFDVDKEKNSVK